MNPSQSIPKVVWEPLGINAKDDFIAVMFGCYTLRVEKMDKNRWWWAVTLHKNQIIRSTYNSDEVASSNENNESFAKTEREAKLLAEIAFIRHFINARAEKLNSVSEMIKKVIDDPKFGDDFAKWIVKKRSKK